MAWFGSASALDFIEISDPWDAQNTIRAHLRAENVVGNRS